MERNFNDLDSDIRNFFANIDNGDWYAVSDPELEKGLQLDLYRYLLYEKHYLVVYELSLPDLKPHLDKELNESIGFCYPQDSLRPDIVVNMGIHGYVCIELKYNERNVAKVERDAAKSRVYVKHCADVHRAYSINLYSNDNRIVQYMGEPCADGDYEYYYEEYTDNPRLGLRKSSITYPIKSLWAAKHIEILRGNGEFAEYGE